MTNVYNCTETAAVNLSGFAWKVLVCRESSNLNLYLIADIDNPSWSVEAQAIFYFRRNGNDPNNYFQNSMDWHKFTADAPSNIVRSVLKQTVLADYVTDMKIRLKVDITTKPAQPIELEEVMQNTATKFRCLIKNVTTLTEGNAFLSSQVNLMGIRWYVNATKIDDSFGVSIHANPRDLSAVWSIDAKVNIKMMPANRPGRNVQPLIIDGNLTFVKDTPFHTFKLLNWRSVVAVDSDYVMHDSAALVVDIKTSPKKRVILFRS